MPDPAKLLNAPPLTVISPTTKLLVLSLEVNVRESVASLDVAPSLTSAAVSAIVGAAAKATLALNKNKIIGIKSLLISIYKPILAKF